MNAPELPLSQIALSEASRPAVLTGGRGDGAGGLGRSVPCLVLCTLLSVALHAVLLQGLEFRQIEREVDQTLLLEVVSPAVKPSAQRVPEPSRVSSESGKVRVGRESTSPARKTASRPVRPPAQARSGPPPPEPPLPVQETVPGTPVSKTEGNEGASRGAHVPVGQVPRLPDATVLANESGQDALKHGAEARFMHGVATEEFVEENYVGEYTLGDAGRVWIEDDRARSGHLILHAEGVGLHRKLFRFNRFIYVYGESPDSSSPILGSVTFFSDGYHIHQFLWQHNSTHAYFPRRSR